jgi:hypothetical protein
VTARQAKAPDALYAFTVMVFVPTSKGMAGMLHCSVPVALPAAPVELDHVSDVTPAVAVPLNAMVAADVETMVIAGEAMVSDGGPAGGAVTGGVVTGGVVTGGVDAAWRVTAID